MPGLTRPLTRSLSVPSTTLLDERPGFPFLGVELVVNGGFDTDTTGWENADGSFATIASVAGQLVVTSINSATGGKVAYQEVPVVPGGSYDFTYTFVSETTVGQVRLGNALNGTQYAQSLTPETATVSFVPTGSSVVVSLLLASTQASGSTAVFDDISIVRTA